MSSEDEETTNAPDAEVVADTPEVDQAPAVVETVNASELADDADGPVPEKIIEKPPAGATSVYSVDPAEELAFGFALEDVQVALQDIDVILTFADGSRIILIGAGIEIMANPVFKVSFLGVEVDKQDLLAKVGLFQEGNVEQVINANTFATAEDEENNVGAPEPTETVEPVEVIVEVIEVPAAGGTTDLQLTGEGIDAEGNSTSISDNDSEGLFDTPPVTAGSSGTPFSGFFDEEGDAFVDVPVVQLDVTLLGLGGITTSTDVSGTNVISGMASIVDAETDETFSVQQTTEVLTGTNGADLIYADDPTRVTAGSTVRKIAIEPDLDGQAGQLQSVNITGLPAGYSVLNANALADGFELYLDPGDPTSLVVELLYQLPTPDALLNSNGHYSDFTMNLELTFDLGGGDTTQAQGSILFAIGDVENESDVLFEDAFSELTYFVLNATPPGNDITAGQGDDTIVASGGLDHIDGGVGNDTASYGQSGAGVIADLTNVDNSSAYAEGDTLTSIENLIGSAYHDTLYGDAGDNTLEGGAGADLLDAREGSNTASYEGSAQGVDVDLRDLVQTGGDAEGDTLTGFGNLIGSGQNDTLSGDVADNRIDAGLGDDTLRGGVGEDTLDGGDGFDTATYATSSSAVNIDLQAGVNLGGEAEGDILSNIEGLVGSDFDDVLTGNAENNDLFGGQGDDTIQGLGGVNTLEGGAGDDLFVAGAGQDQIDGGLGDNDLVDYQLSATGVNVDLLGGIGVGGDAEGDSYSGLEGVIGSNHADLLDGDSSDNNLQGLDGNDRLDGRNGDDSLTGGDGQDTLFGGLGDDTLSGGDDADLIDGGFGADVVDGGAGDDTLVAGSGDDSVVGGAGQDEIEGGAGADTLDGGGDADSLVGGGDNDSISGGSGADILFGNDGDDTLLGGQENDSLTGGDGADLIDGGDGVDTADYSGSAFGVTVDLETNLATGGDAAGDTLSSIENLTGSDENDVLRASDAANTLNGGAGNDTLEGRGGADFLSGGSGTDLADYSSSSAIDIDLNRLGGQAGGDAQGDTLDGIEGVLGGAGDDLFVGDTEDNVFSGALGNDSVTGGAGADTLDGGGGAADVLYYTGSVDGVTVYLDGRRSDNGDAEGDVVTGFEIVYGSTVGDTLIGNSDDNSLFGDGGNDILEGGDGADLLDGGIGIDTASYAGAAQAVSINLATGINGSGDEAGDNYVSIERFEGSDFDDTLTGGTVAVTLDGGFGADSLTGSSNNDSLLGGEGNDTLIGGAGADSLIGGAGVDLVDYSTSDASVAINLSAGVSGDATGGHADGDDLIGIENVTGSLYADTLIGSTDANVIVGGDGSDVIAGLDGADTLTGGDESGTRDRVDYTLSSTGVNVDLQSGLGQFGHAEGDILSGFEDVSGSNLSDTILGDAQNNILSGQGGSDVLSGAGGSDTLQGGDGDDTLQGGTGADSLEGGSGLDVADYQTAGAGVTIDLETGTASGSDATGDILNSIEGAFGSGFEDVLTGSTQSNILFGFGQNDTIIGGQGADTIDGGAGLDTASYTTSGLGVIVNLDLGTGFNGDAQGDQLNAIENLIGSAFDDALIGNSIANELEGGAGEDTLFGADGNDLLIGGEDADWLEGGAGADTLQGGDGSDTAVFEHESSAVFVSLADGSNNTGDSLQSIENLVGSDFEDTLSGDSGVNTLMGGLGNDSLFGGGGNDSILGGDDNDSLNGWLGSDTLVGGVGIDQAVYFNATAGVSVNLETNVNQFDIAQGDSLVSIENVVGSGFGDTLTGNAADNVLDGNGGNDQLSGGIGADTLIGDAGNDTASYSASTNAVTVSLTTGMGLNGDAQGDVLSGIENLIGSDGSDQLTGDVEANSLVGGLADDTLIGLNDNDTLEGGFGDDFLIGGAGSDSLDGGDNVDTASYSGSGFGVTLDLTLSGAQVSAGTASGDILSNIENLIGSDFADALIGDSSENLFEGGDDNDTLLGGAGADTLIGGDGQDLASYAGSNAGVHVWLDGSSLGQFGHAQGDDLQEIEDLLGSGLADSLTGSDQANEITGGTGNDTIEGGAGADTLDGGLDVNLASYVGSSAAVIVNLTTGSGTGGDAQGDVLNNFSAVLGSLHNDTLIGGSSSSTLFGNDGADSLVGQSQADELSGGDGADWLDGQAGADTLLGGAGNDTLIGNTGAEELVGGADIDVVSYAGSAAVNVDLVSGIGTGGNAEGDTYAEIENLWGSGNDDTLTGNGQDNSLEGQLGDDSLTGLAGADTLIGGEGADTLTGGTGSDLLDGGVGIDTASYAGAGSAIAVDLTLGVQAISSTESSGDQLVGIENLIGSGGGDTLIGNAASNVIEGGLGADSIEGGLGADTLLGGGGDDTISGGTGADSIDGGQDDDYIFASSGAQTLIGGDGTDTVDYSGSLDGVDIDLSAGPANDAQGGDAEGDDLFGFEVVVGSDFDDTLQGDTGDNGLFGGMGDDYFFVSQGGDTLDGGDDIDTADFSFATGAISVDLGAEVGTGGGLGTNILQNIENIVATFADDTLFGSNIDNGIIAGDGDDSLNGFDGNDTLDAGAGEDTLIGGDGDDSLLGGVDDDILIGGSGADTLDGGAGFDVVDYSGESSAVFVSTSFGNGTGGWAAAGDILTSISSVIGTDYGDSLRGNNGGDRFYGGDGNDTITGGSEFSTHDRDILHGEDGDDYITSGNNLTPLNSGWARNGDEIDGGEGNDTLIGGAAQDTIFGGDGNDSITAGDEDDQIYGGSGVDTINADLGADTIDGGADFDNLSYALSDAGIFLTLDGVTAGVGGYAEGDIITNFERIFGSDGFADTIIGGAADDIIDGLGGADFIEGNGGADELQGGEGNDTLNGGAGIDTLFGEGGNDSLLGGAENDLLYGNDSADTLEGGDGADLLSGGDGIDTAIYANSGSGVSVDLNVSTAQTSAGEASGDTLTSIENVTGTDQSDTLTGDAEDNALIGLAGADSLEGGDGADQLDGGSENDTISGGSGNDTVLGGTGNDYIFGDLGADSIEGGSGIDTIDYSLTGGVQVDLGLIGAQSGGLANNWSFGDILINIENVLGSNSAGYGDILTGSDQANLLDGQNGDDLFFHSIGADTILGGAGVDEISYSGATSAVFADLSLNQITSVNYGTIEITGVENITGSAQSDTLYGDTLANVISGGAGEDLIDGAVGNDSLFGGLGADYLIGDEGDDSLSGGSEDDTLDGGMGADTLEGGTGIDTADYSNAAAGVAVALEATQAVGAGYESGDVLVDIENLLGSAFADLLTGSAEDNLINGDLENDTLFGLDGADTLIGGTGDDSLEGGLGNDLVEGGDDNDTLIAGVGDDTLDGGAGIDTIDLSGLSGPVTLDLANSSNNAGTDIAGDTYIDIENIIGTAFADSLTGNSDQNVILAGTGNDTLAGGAGSDVLDGGADSDFADYSGSSAGVTIDLENNTASGGHAQGDTLTDIENVTGSDFSDALSGDGGDNLLDGGLLDDTLAGGDGADTLIGGDGLNILTGGLGADRLEGTGTDTARYTDTVDRVLDLRLTTQVGNLGEEQTGDVWVGIENVTGGGGQDTIIGDVANNVLDGGAGIDEISYSFAGAAITGTFGDGGVVSGTASGTDTIFGFELLSATNFSDAITVTDADLTVLAGGGDDTVISGAINTTIEGEGGTNTVSYQMSGAGVTVDLTLSSAQFSAGNASGDILSGVQNLVGSTFGDALIGDGQGNQIDGDDGADTLSGAGGIDTLSGGEGNDVLTGGAGADELIGGAGIDEVSYAGAGGGVAVNLDDGSAGSGSDAQGDTYVSIENVTGSDFSDTLIGDDEANHLRGLDSNDTLVGGGGTSDTLDGGSGVDTADYSDSSDGVQINLGVGTAFGGDATGDVLLGIENLIGTDQADILAGADGVDNALFGGLDADVFLSDTGADSYHGGAGSDELSYLGSGGAININLATDVSTGFDADGDSYSEIEIIGGSDFGDEMIADASDIAFLGNGGADTITGGIGDNVLDGGAGDDVISGGAGTDVISAGDGFDLVFALGDGDTIDGGGNRDTLSYDEASSGVIAHLSSATGNDEISNVEDLIGSDFDDQLIGDANANQLSGGAGADTITGGGGSDTLNGNDGADQFDVLSTGNMIDGGDQIDTVDYTGAAPGVTAILSSTAGDDTLIAVENLVGSTGDDVLTGDTVANDIQGGTGNDTIQSGGGADTLDGGIGGADWLSFAGVSDALEIDLSDGSNNQSLSLSNFENLLGGTGDDELLGDTGANVIQGGLGADTIDGDLGADTLDGGAGNADWVVYSSISADVEVNLATGANNQLDVLSGFENLSGGAGNDSLTGDSAANQIEGALGADTLSGGGGADTLNGGGGADLILGEAGGYVINGGDQIDTVSYASNASGVTVILSSALGDDTISQVENVIGSLGADVLIGDALGNNIQGGIGADTVSGGGGSDVLDGGVGGGDWLDYSAVGTGVDVDLSDGSNNQSDTISNFENLVGGDGADALTGDAFDNELLGGLAADLLSGGDGADTLEGGAGSDTVDGGVGQDLIISSADGDDIDGGNQIDTVSYSGLSTGVTAVLSGVGDDTLTNIENIIGSDGNDMFIGDAVDNDIFGGIGDDTISGGGGSDTLDGGVGNADLLDYSANTDDVVVDLGSGFNNQSDTISNFEQLLGGAGNDSLTGTTQSNEIVGGMGADTISGAGGSDTLDGGGGLFDLVDYSALADDLTVDLSDGSNNQSDVLVNFEQVQGGTGNDALVGNIAANAIIGGDGADTIDGGGGSDTLDGGLGVSDLVDYGSINSGVEVNLATGANNQSDILSNFEQVTAGDGANLLTGSAQANVITGGAGSDTISGGGGSDTLDGGGGATDLLDYSAISSGVEVDFSTGLNNQNDTITNFEYLHGGAGNDSLNGDVQDNEIVAGFGSDTVAGGGGADTLDGGVGGQDWIDYSALVSGLELDLSDGSNNQLDTVLNFENILSGGGDDSLAGSIGSNVILGGFGADTIAGGGGADTLDGGDGFADLVDYSGIATGVVVDLSNGTNNQSDSLSNFEQVISGSGADSLTGNGSDNVLEGGLGADTISGGSGGADTLDGGGGTLDWLDYSSIGSGVAVSLADNTNDQSDVISNFENLVGGNGADSLTGTNGSNVIEGGQGADTISGAGGTDTLDGGGGLFDVLDYSDISGNVGVDLSDGSNNQSDLISNFEHVLGGAGSDTLTGTSGSNFLSGGGNSDSLYGGGGSDILEGGAGADVIYLVAGGNDVDGGSGNDTVDYSGAGGPITAVLSSSAGDDVISEIENIIGSNQGDSLVGDGAANSILGGLGADTIIGGGGTDTLNGGSGAFDLLDYSALGADIEVDLSDGSNNQSDVISNFENLSGGFGDDSLAGTAGANVISGGVGDDTISGNGGADTLDGGGGLEDWLDYSGISSGVETNLANGSNNQSDMILNFENVIAGAGGDLLVGSTGANHIMGGFGADTIMGGGGSDTLDGGSGSADWIDYSGILTGVNVDLSNGINNQSDELTNFENVNGGSGSDSLTGDLGSNEIVGGAGADTVSGGGGSDTLDGGEGLEDWLDYSEIGIGVSVNLSSGVNDQSDVISNFEHLLGGDGDDVLIGSNNANEIIGGFGNDIISGSGGEDTLQGGQGADEFSLDASDLLSAGLGIDGGTGEDTVVASAGSVVESNFDGVLSNIEVLDFTAGDMAADLDISTSQIQAWTDTNNVLEVQIGSNDSVSLVEDISFYDVDTTMPNQTIYTIYDGTDFANANQVAQLSVLAVA